MIRNFYDLSNLKTILRKKSRSLMPLHNEKPSCRFITPFQQQKFMYTFLVHKSNHQLFLLMSVLNSSDIILVIELKEKFNPSYLKALWCFLGYQYLRYQVIHLTFRVAIRFWDYKRRKAVGQYIFSDMYLRLEICMYLRQNYLWFSQKPHLYYQNKRRHLCKNSIHTSYSDLLLKIQE